MASFSFFSNRKGFTIIELMMALSIIGILAAVIAPSYEKYMLRAKSMEGPIALTQIYAAEQEVYADTGTYVACVFPLGLEAEYKGYFITGFFWGVNLVGKSPTILAGCEASSVHGQPIPSCAINYSKEVECTPLDTASPSDHMIIPTILKKRGGGDDSNTFKPYLNGDYSSNENDTGVVCNNSNLTDVPGGTNGTERVNGVPVGYKRLDKIFVACTVAALAPKTSTNTTPTAYTIDQNKILTQTSIGY